MAPRSPPHGRALIVEDDIFRFSILEAEMYALGFDVCDLAANGQKASMLARDQPDVVLMDINLEGGREGIEVARWLRKVCEAPIVFITAYTDRDTVERIHQQVPEHQCSQAYLWWSPCRRRGGGYSPLS